VAVERLGLVRTLRDLGIDLATVHRVLASEVTMASVAAAHAQVLEVQIRALRLRRAVLRAVAQRGSTPREVELMHKLARYSDEERRRMIHEFLDEVFGGLELDPEFERRMRSAMPELPDEPSPAQVEAWVELAELVGQEDFRRRIRQMAERAASDRAPGSAAPDTAEAQAASRLVYEKAAGAVAGGIDPASPQARPVIGEIARAFARAYGRVDDPAFRAWLVEMIEAFGDPRVDRYWRLLAVINGWPAMPSQMPAWEWTVAALREGS